MKTDWPTELSLTVPPPHRFHPLIEMSANLPHPMPDLSAMLPHVALVAQPAADRFISCPCARCQLWREEYFLAKETFERSVKLQPLPDSLYPEAPTQQDRDVLDAIDVVAKIAVVLFFLGFISACYHAIATGAVERMLSR